MMRYIVNVVIIITLTTSLSGQNNAYQLYDAEGKKAKYEKMMKVSADADIVLFGELHNDPIAHWLQIELAEDLFDHRGEELILGAEMFEADNQLILDEYLKGLITEVKFEEEARIWKNYKTDYKPLVLFAKDNNLDFFATNIPRRYANSVYKQGLEVLNELSEEARDYIAPLPISYDTLLNCYLQLSQGDPEMGGHGSRNLADAQAVKDATMSHFILKNWEPGKLFLHFNGAYHSDDFESINYFIKRENPDITIVTISTVSQVEISDLDESNEGRADFIIVVPENMTKTH